MRRIPRAAWAILAVALAVRVATSFWLGAALPAGTDESAYQSIAVSVSEGHGFPPRPDVIGGGASALVPPGYPYLIGGAYAATGSTGKGVARVLDGLMGTVAVGLLGLIAWQLTRRRRAALWAMGLGALYPPLIVAGAPLMTESLFLPLVLGAIAAVLEFRESRALRWVVIAGALLGLGVLTKTVGEILTLALALAVWLAPRLSVRALAAPALLLAVTVVAVAPWLVRNAEDFGRVVPVSNEVGYGLAGAFNPLTRDDPSHQWRPPFTVPEYRPTLLNRGLDEPEVSDRLRSKALGFAGDHPFYVFPLSLQNGVRMAELRVGGPSSLDSQLVGFGNSAVGSRLFRAFFRLDQLSFLLLAGLAIVAAVRGRFQMLPLPIAIGLAVMALALVPIAGAARFRLPVDLLLIIGVAPLLERAWSGRFAGGGVR